jgi:hypothetical protein
LPDFTSQNKVGVDPRYTPTLRWIYPNLVADLKYGNGRWIYGYQTGFCVYPRLGSACGAADLAEETNKSDAHIRGEHFLYLWAYQGL